MQERAEQNHIVSYGRRRGRSLTAKKKGLVGDLLPKVSLAIPEEDKINTNTLFSENKKELWVEVGFGSGEHLASQADKHPDIGFIGSEVYENGVAQLLEHIDSKQLKNLIVYSDDARYLLEKLPDNSVDRLFILFPDPWPKKKHHKRRIINQGTLDILKQVIKQGGNLRIATDHIEYTKWIMVQIFYHGSFEWPATTPFDWKKVPEGHSTTKYEKKAKNQGNSIVFLDFKLNML